MSSNPSIHYYTQQEIDKEKWDACMAAADNGLIYGYSFYLDAMSKQWDALVLNDYEAVMPLTWNKKYGVYYLYQPFLCASLGVFGKSLSATTVQAFLSQIPAKFRYADISLNHGNLFQLNIPARVRKNFVLNLDETYAVLFSQFSENTKRNIKKATQKVPTLLKPSLEQVLLLAKKQVNLFAKVNQDDFNRFSTLYRLLEQKKAAFTYGICRTDGRLLASGIFFLWQYRAYYILVGNHPDGKTTGASHALINEFIKDHAERRMVLDFEGSDVAGLAAFYGSFGAVEENYPSVQYNRLPALVKWLKQ